MSTYLDSIEYERRQAVNSASSQHNFVFFTHPNGLSYFGFIDNGKALLRSEAFSSELERNQRSAAILPSIYDKNNYRIETISGESFLILHHEGKEVGRSCPMKYEYEAFSALNTITSSKRVTVQSVGQTTKNEISSISEVSKAEVKEINPTDISTPKTEDSINNPESNSKEETPPLPIEKTTSNSTKATEKSVLNLEPSSKIQPPHMGDDVLSSNIASNELTTNQKKNWLWLILIPILIGIALGIYLYGSKLSSDKSQIGEIQVNQNRDSTLSDVDDKETIEAKAKWLETLGNKISVRLPDGSLISIPENGTERKLIDYIEANCGTSEMKKTWFNMDRILFKSGTNELKEVSNEQLILIAKIFKSYPNKKFKIGGYTDNVGDPESNIRLSAERARVATEALVSFGADSTRMRYEGYGQEHPICPDNNTQECREKNRRIAIRVDVCK